MQGKYFPKSSLRIPSRLYGELLLTVASVTDILKSTTLQNIPWRSVFAGQMVVYMQGQACIEVAQRLNYLDMGRLGFEGYCMRFEGSHKHWAVSAKSYPSLITGVLR